MSSHGFDTTSTYSQSVARIGIWLLKPIEFFNLRLERHLIFRPRIWKAATCLPGNSQLAAAAVLNWWRRRVARQSQHNLPLTPFLIALSISHQNWFGSQFWRRQYNFHIQTHMCTRIRNWLICAAYISLHVLSSNAGCTTFHYPDVVIVCLTHISVDIK